VREVQLAFQVEGRLERMKVEEGDRIAKDQSLASLETGYLKDTLTLAEGRAEAQHAQLAKFEAGNRPQEIAEAKAESDRAEAAALNAHQRYDRQKALPIDTVGTRQALDSATAAMHEADAQLKSAREALNLALAGSRYEDILAQRAEVKADDALVDLARRRLTDAELKSPDSGVILTRIHEPGAILLPGAPVYTLALDRPVWVRAFIPETQLGRVAPGTKAEVSSDSAPGKVYSAQVGFVSPVAEFTPKTVETTDLRTALVYRLRVIIDHPDAQLRQGMPVTVRLLPQGS